MHDMTGVEVHMANGKDPGDALRDNQNKGLQDEQERLKDPDHHTPDEEGEDPIPADQLGSADKAEDSPDRMKNPPQVEGPRERSNDMV
jgi:hypothetical protein